MKYTIKNNTVEFISESGFITIKELQYILNIMNPDAKIVRNNAENPYIGGHINFEENKLVLY